jgi:hypothetical protein
MGHATVQVGDHAGLRVERNAHEWLALVADGTKHQPSGQIEGLARTACHDAAVGLPNRSVPFDPHPLDVRVAFERDG